MSDLDLRELDRLEKEMQGKVMSTNVSDIHAQLRPLLDLVGRLGDALGGIDTVEGFTSTAQCAGFLRGDWKEIRAARNFYRRAKEGAL